MTYKTIICPVDGSELGDKAMLHAAYLSKTCGAKLILLHVSEKTYRSAHIVTNSKEWQAIHEGWLNEARELLHKEKDKLASEGLNNVDLTYRDGEASNEIVAEADEKRADLIVMASHRYTPVGKLFMGSVIDKVTKRAPCPVLWVFN